jgi:hypothetical protein
MIINDNEKTTPMGESRNNATAFELDQRLVEEINILKLVARR